jgi:hypothetical protein
MAEISIFNIGNFSQKIVLKCPLVMQKSFSDAFFGPTEFLQYHYPSNLLLFLIFLPFSLLSIFSK